MNQYRRYDMKGNRIMSERKMPPGEKTCNAQLQSRDGYCQSPGLTNFNRCKTHGGKRNKAAIDLFKKSVGLEDASKLQTLIDDTLNMDNELASGKTMLLTVLETHQRASHTIDRFLSNPPSRPLPGSDLVEIETYNAAVQLHNDIIGHASKLKSESFKQAATLIRTLTTGIHRNSRIKEGNKFQLDAKQIASILKVQLSVMKDNCKGCPKFRDVISGIQAGTRDIPIDPHINRQTQEAMGRRAYNDAVNTIKKKADDSAPQDAEYEEV